MYQHNLGDSSMCYSLSNLLAEDDGTTLDSPLDSDKDDVDIDDSDETDEATSDKVDEGT